MHLARLTLSTNFALVAAFAMLACCNPSSLDVPPGPPGLGVPGGAVPEAATPTELPWNLARAETVTLSGTVVHEDGDPGSVRIDFLGASETNPGLLQTITLQQPGPWTVPAPIGAGKVHVVAFLQGEQGGPPRPGQPAGRLAEAIEIGDKDLSGLDLVLLDDPDLGELTPGEPGEAGSPPVEVPPTDPAPPPETPTPSTETLAPDPAAPPLVGSPPAAP